MTIINTNPDRIIQLGYEGEDRVTVLRFRYGSDWLENGEGIFRIRVRRHGETQAYNAQLVTEDPEYNCLLMTVTNVELSVKGSGEMQIVYSGADFVKKSPIYSYNVSRAVDEAVNPPAQDVYTQIIESLSDLQTDVRQIDLDVADLSELTTAKIGDLSALTTTAKTDLVSAINEVNEHGGTDITVDDALSTTSTNPVQNKVITGALAGKADKSLVDVLADDVADVKTDTGALKTAIQGKADTQTVSALADAVNGLDSDVQGLQTTVQSKADTATVTALSGTVSNLSDAAQQYMEHTNSAIAYLRDNKANKSYVDDELATKANAQTVTALSGTVTGLQTTKADKSYVDTQLAEKASTQTVSDLADDVSDLQTGLSGKVGDVQVNNSSIVTNGVAKITAGLGLSFAGNTIKANTATENAIKNGGTGEMLLNPLRQHYSAFYGLAKVAGHDEKDSTLPVGTYTNEAKTAIQTMLNVPSTNDVVNDVQINGTSIVSDGVANVPIANTNTFGTVKISPTLRVAADNSVYVQTVSASDVKAGATWQRMLTPERQHESTFYGLAKVAGHDEKNSTLPVGTYSEEAKTAIRTMLGLQEMYEWYKNQT